jgi:rubredoxin
MLDAENSTVRWCCPVCGFPELDAPPYANIGAAPYEARGGPPYEAELGEASYDVCPCCGFEFGNDDNPGTVRQGASFEEYRREWIADGCRWFMSGGVPPDGWSPRRQLDEARIAVPAGLTID